MKIMDSYFKLLLNRVGTIHNTISRKAIIKINHKSKGKKQQQKKNIFISMPFWPEGGVLFLMILFLLLPHLMN